MAKEKTTKPYKEYTLEELKQELAKLDEQLGRQHGREGHKFDDPEKEKRRLWNNLVSRRSRLLRRNLKKHQDEQVNKILNIHQDEDEYGISPRDERRYRSKFKSGYIGAPVYVKYIMMMTGLKLFQIYQLQERTGLIPTPRITKEEADANYKYCYETGDMY